MNKKIIEVEIPEFFEDDYSIQSFVRLISKFVVANKSNISELDRRRRWFRLNILPQLFITFFKKKKVRDTIFIPLSTT